jgi:hypothetical protein
MKRPLRFHVLLLGALGIAILTSAILWAPVRTWLSIRRESANWTKRVEYYRAEAGSAGRRMGGVVPDHATLLPAALTGRTVLRRAQSPYVVVSETFLERGATLSLEPGVEVLFGGMAHLMAHGTLEFLGASNQWIRLAPLTNGAPWMGLFLAGDGTSNVLRYVRMEDSIYGLRAVRAKLDMDHWVCRNVREPFSGHQCVTRITSSRVIYGNYAAQGNVNSFKFTGGEVTVEDCELHCPSTDVKVDAFDVDGVRRGLFRGNLFYGATSPNTDGIDIGMGSRNIRLENNMILGFSDKGISVGEGADIVVSNTVVAHCGMGIGVKDKARVRVDRATLYGNQTAVACFEKVAGQGGGEAEVLRSIIAGSSGPAVTAGPLSRLRVADTLCDTETLPGEGNVRGRPVFVAPERKDFRVNRVEADGGEGRVTGGASTWGALDFWTARDGAGVFNGANGD